MFLCPIHSKLHATKDEQAMAKPCWASTARQAARGSESLAQGELLQWLLGRAQSYLRGLPGCAQPLTPTKMQGNCQTRPSHTNLTLGACLASGIATNLLSPFHPCCQFWREADSTQWVTSGEVSKRVCYSTWGGREGTCARGDALAPGRSHHHRTQKGLSC